MNGDNARKNGIGVPKQGKKPKRDKTCIDCGVPISPNATRCYPCSVSKRRKFQFKPKNCDVCGEEFMPTGGMSKYCSPECVKTATTRIEPCEECGSMFAQPKWARLRFCSPKCSYAAKCRAEGKERWPKEATCQGCGERFMAKEAKNKYCSSRCANRTRARAAAKRTRQKQPWGLILKGELFCRNCHRPALHLHHIVPRSRSRKGQDDVQGNGMPLCFDCHRGWHDRRVTLYRGCLTAHELATAISLTSAAWVDRNYPLPEDVAFVEAYAALAPSELSEGWEQRNRERIASVREFTPDD
jgi:hypothetical protein